MVTIRLTEKELELLVNELQNYLSELRGEIFDTDNPSYKDNLKDEQATLEAVLTKLKANTPTRAGHDVCRVGRAETVRAISEEGELWT